MKEPVDIEEEKRIKYWQPSININLQHIIVLPHKRFEVRIF